jgi:lipopolysaccharide transport system permease protein
MLLALRRLFGLAAPLASEGGVTDSRAEKWVIEPARLGFVARVEELWRYRRILWFFAVRRVTERYEGTTLGIFWLFARPLAPIAISTVIFGRMLNVPSDGVPYFLFFLAGMSCWRIFERSMLWVTRSLEQNRGLLKKVYFPRLLAPISSVAPALTEFLILLALLLGACVVFWIKDGILYLRLGPAMLAAAAAVALTVFFSIALGLWTSVLQVRHKDVRFTIRYFMQFWLFLTPVIYPMSQVPAEYRWLISLNPMASFVELYKWGMLGIGEFPARALPGSLGVTAVVFVLGLMYFSRSEAASVDNL